MQRYVLSAAALLAATNAVLGGGTGNGPDVIVSTIGSTLSETGVIGGIGGYAMTTVSCNLGEADAIWIDSGAQDTEHPVIGQNMFRLMNGRFEQIGQAWLKHGFCALDAPSCGAPYEPNGSCDWLGTHATDTYDAFLNAEQTGMGPKSEVNPWTGDFPYPYIKAWAQSGNAIFKRLQIAQADLDPTLNGGALYFGESQYICTDEVEMNRYNNCSYRRVVVAGASGSQWNLEFTGGMFVQQPAIMAWQAADPTVVMSTIDVVNDGRFILASKARDFGTGVWEYEYALYNMNVHRAAGSFSVPVDPGVTISDFGFHDVPYHSTESFAGTDWGASYSAGNLKWQTELFILNPNANAVRWGTLYNFRFRANTAPMTGNVTIGLFKPGQVGDPNTVAGSALVPSLPPPPCAADLDGDGDTDSADLNIVLIDFGCIGGSCVGDVDGDNDTDSTDLNVLLTEFGCTP